MLTFLVLSGVLYDLFDINDYVGKFTEGDSSFSMLTPLLLLLLVPYLLAPLLARLGEGVEGVLGDIGPAGVAKNAVSACWVV